MLDHLHIQNYRLFKDLKIDKLGQVNLIAGKNNTGKTALLEALRILESDGNVTVINDIVLSRGDLQVGNDMVTYDTLFYEKRSNIQIRINLILIEKEQFHELQAPSMMSTSQKDVGIKQLLGRLEFKYIYKVKSGNELDTYKNSENPLDKAIFISISTEGKSNSKFWDNISLTPREDNLVEILKIIDRRIKKVRLDNDKPKILLENEEYPIPLKNFGDGANRLFTIALALVNAKDKVLLIDEFEVGLHHSVQEQLWEVIFKYAKEWNIQVFVTTHSQDTVKAFYYVSSKEEYKGMGQYMRLQPSRSTGEIEAVIYTEDSLETAFDLNLETR